MGELVKLEQLNWGDKLCNLLHSMWLNQTLCDTAIVCRDDSTLRCHKCVVAASSSAMSRVLSDLESKKELGPGKEILVRTNIERDIWEAVLTFMYTGTAIIKPERMTYLRRVAEKFHITELHDLCHEYEKQKSKDGDPAMSGAPPPNMSLPMEQAPVELQTPGEVFATAGQEALHMPAFPQQFATPNLSVNTPVFNEHHNGDMNPFQLQGAALPGGPPISQASNGFLSTATPFDVVAQGIPVSHSGGVVMPNQTYGSDIINAGGGGDALLPGPIGDGGAMCNIQPGDVTQAPPITYANLITDTGAEVRVPVNVQCSQPLAVAASTQPVLTAAPIEQATSAGTGACMFEQTDSLAAAAAVTSAAMDTLADGVFTRNVVLEAAEAATANAHVTSLQILAANALGPMGIMESQQHSIEQSHHSIEQFGIVDNTVSYHTGMIPASVVPDTVHSASGSRASSSPSQIPPSDDSYGPMGHSEMADSSSCSDMPNMGTVAQVQPPSQDHDANSQLVSSLDGSVIDHQTSIGDNLKSVNCIKDAIVRFVDQSTGHDQGNVTEGDAVAFTEGPAVDQPKFRADKTVMEFDSSNLKVCRICQKHSSSARLNVQHGLTKHPGQKLMIYYCEACDADYTTHQELSRHLARHNSKGSTYLCEYCGSPQASTKELQLHIAKQHPVKSMSCEQCRAVFQNRQEYEAHAERFCPGGPFNISYRGIHPIFTCDACRLPCSSLPELRVHIAAAHRPASAIVVPPVSDPAVGQTSNATVDVPPVVDPTIGQASSVTVVVPPVVDSAIGQISGVTVVVPPVVDSAIGQTSGVTVDVPPVVDSAIGQTSGVTVDVPPVGDPTTGQASDVIVAGVQAEAYTSPEVSEAEDEADLIQEQRVSEPQLVHRVSAVDGTLDSSSAASNSAPVFKTHACKFCAKSFRSVGGRRRHEMLHSRPRPCKICGRIFSTAYLLKKHKYFYHLEFTYRPCNFKCDHCGASFSSSNMKDYHTSTVHKELFIPRAIREESSQSFDDSMTNTWTGGTRTPGAMLSVESACRSDANPMLAHSIDINKTSSNDSMGLLDTISGAAMNISDRDLVQHVEEMGKTLKDMPMAGVEPPVSGVDMIEEEMEMETDYKRVVSSEDPFIPPPTAMNG